MWHIHLNCLVAKKCPWPNDWIICHLQSSWRSTGSCQALAFLSEAKWKISEKSSDVISCSDSQRWFHFVCETLVTSKEISVNDDADYHCLQWQGITKDNEWPDLVLTLPANECKLNCAEEELDELLMEEIILDGAVVALKILLTRILDLVAGAWEQRWGS